MTKMDYMEWNAEHLVDVPALDNQHRELVSFFNGTVGKCSGDLAEERAYFDTVINPFIDFLSKHFKAEEQWLSGGDPDHCEKHTLDHVKLMEKINFVKQEVESGRWKMNLYVLATTLRDWFMYHFESFDLAAKELFREGDFQAGKEVCLVVPA